MENDLYEGLPVGLWRTSIENGRFLHANKATISILGFSSFKELANYSINELYEKNIRNEIIKKLLETQEISDFKLNIRRQDGIEIKVSISAKINIEKGYIEGTIRDITNEPLSLIPHLKKISLIKESIKKKIEESNQISLYKDAKIV